MPIRAKSPTTETPPDSVANWKAIKTDIIQAAPERLQAVPYQVKSIAVRDACLAVRRCKQANKELAAAKKAGQRLDESLAVVKFRGRKHPRRTEGQSADAPQRVVSPVGSGEGAAACWRDPSPRRLYLALDPGIRSFLTWYAETDVGHIGPHDFGRIQRLCEHLDGLLGRATKASGRRKRNMCRAASRMRVRVAHLIKELHH